MSAIEEIFSTIVMSDLEMLKHLVNQEIRDRDIDELKDKDGNTLLIRAAVEQEYEICEYLIYECDASINTKNYRGRTALIEMVRLRSSKWLKSLTSLLSSSVNEQDADGKTAIMYAVIGAGAFASKRGNIDIAKQLIDHGANLNHKDISGNTTLRWAMLYNDKSKTLNNTKMVELLEIETLKYIAVVEFKKIYNFSYTGGELFYTHKMKDINVRACKLNSVSHITG